MNHIYVNPARTAGQLDRNVFGAFAEHLARCIYGGIYDPTSRLANDQGQRQDVVEAITRLNVSNLRYPGGNFVSGYRWRDGVGPRAERPERLDLAWGVVDTNHFGTNEFIDFCRLVNAEPYLVVNCGDGDLREARDWVEYCNGTETTTLVKLRQQHGYDAPHRVHYWGIGNEVDGPWQIGRKTPQEYARAFTEFGKVMKWVDPEIKLVAAGISDWNGDLVEHGQLLLEQAGKLVDYVDLHFYANNKANDFATFMATAESVENRIAAFEGLIQAVKLDQKIERDIFLAISEWNVWYRANMQTDNFQEVYNLEDALVVALFLNVFIRRAHSVKMANLAQIVNTIAPILTRPDGLVLQTTFFPFELFSRLAGTAALDIFWEGDTFSAGDQTGLRTLDVSATFDAASSKLAVFVVNRSQDADAETTLVLDVGRFTGSAQINVINGPDIKTANTFDAPDQVGVTETTVATQGRSLVHTFPAHSVTAIVCEIAQ